jgi:hypothetical protein
MNWCGGVAVAVPVVTASTVAWAATEVAVAAFPGVGVLVTTMGVTQLVGRGVGVPVVVAWKAAVAAWAAATSASGGVGVLVITTRKGVRVGTGVSGEEPTPIISTG